MATHQSALTSTRTYSPSSEVVTTRQTDGAAHKLKPRSFYKSAHLRVHPCRLPPWCEPRLTIFHQELGHILYSQHQNSREYHSNTSHKYWEHLAQILQDGQYHQILQSMVGWSVRITGSGLNFFSFLFLFLFSFLFTFLFSIYSIFSI